MTSPTDQVTLISVGIAATGDGKDDNTALNVWTNLASGAQFSHNDFSNGAINVGDTRTETMIMDANPTRAQIEAGFQLRLKWNPHGSDRFIGYANVDIIYVPLDKRRYRVSDLQMSDGVEWYTEPLAGAGTPIP
jgi:hypothetical protein